MIYHIPGSARSTFCGLRIIKMLIIGSFSKECWKYEWVSILSWFSMLWEDWSWLSRKNGFSLGLKRKGKDILTLLGWKISKVIRMIISEFYFWARFLLINREALIIWCYSFSLLVSRLLIKVMYLQSLVSPSFLLLSFSPVNRFISAIIMLILKAFFSWTDRSVDVFAFDYRTFIYKFIKS